MWIEAIPRARALWPALLLAGCTVGPGFERPAPPAAASYLAPGEAHTADGAPGATPPAGPGAPLAVIGAGPQAGWWSAFGSPQLDALVAQALAHNASLAASDATLAAAEAEARAVAGRRAPQIDASARIEQEQVNLAAFGFDGAALGVTGNPAFHLYSVGGGIGYDLDLFGGLRRQAEQSAAEAEAQQRRTEAAHLALAGQVVNQVLGIAAIRARIAVAQQILADDERTLDLTSRRRQAGEGTLVEVLNAQGQATADRAILPDLDQQLAAARHLLATLTGVAPADLGPTDIDLATLTLPAAVPVTLPSALVHQRPDILEAEARLHAATAAIGVATARLYPDITLGATLTQSGPATATLLTNAFRGYDVFAGVTAPIFHGGTLRAQRAAAVARATAAQATYRQTVLDAFGQVADLLSALDTDARRVALQGEADAVARRSLALSRRSFAVGNSGVLQVLDSQRLAQRAGSDLVMARATQLLDIARLYVATAGGWRGRPADDAAARAAPTG